MISITKTGSLLKIYLTTPLVNFDQCIRPPSFDTDSRRVVPVPRIFSKVLSSPQGLRSPLFAVYEARLNAAQLLKPFI